MSVNRSEKKENVRTNEKWNKPSCFRPSYLLDRFARWLYLLIISGFFGRLFTSYAKEEKLLKRLSEKRRKQRKVHLEPKYTDRRVASVIEKLFLTRFLKRVRYFLMRTPIGYYVDAVLSYALVSLLTSFLLTFLSGAPSIYEGYALTNYALETIEQFVMEAQFWINVGLFVLVALFTLPIRSCPFVELKTESFFLSAFFERLLGAKSELTENRSTAASGSYRSVFIYRAIRLGLLLSGIAAGVLSAFISPLYFVLALLLLILISIIIRTPEAGLVLSVLLLPMLEFFGSFGQLYSAPPHKGISGNILSLIGLPTLILGTLVLFTAFSYLIKVFRKKRLFRFSLLDGVVLFLGVGILFYGFFPKPSAASILESVFTVILILIYFLCVNLLRTEAWVHRVLAVLQFTLFSVLTVGIAVYFFGVPDLGWLSTEHITGVKGDISALFGGEAFLGSYLVLMFPLSLGTIFSVKSAACKIFAAMSLPEILFVATLLESKLPLSFCLLGLCVFALFCSYKTLYIAPLTAFGMGVVYQLIPNGTNLAVYLKGYIRRNFGQGVYLWDRLFTTPYELSLLGEGFGNARFYEIFSASDPFSDAGFWLRTLFGVGIPGLIVILAFVFILMQHCFEEMRQLRSRLRIALIGGFSALLILLPYGAFLPLFADFRMLFLFWITVGLTVACCRISAERSKDGPFLKDDPTSVRSAETILY